MNITQSEIATEYITAIEKTKKEILELTHELRRLKRVLESDETEFVAFLAREELFWAMTPKTAVLKKNC